MNATFIVSEREAALLNRQMQHAYNAQATAIRADAARLPSRDRLTEATRIAVRQYVQQGIRHAEAQQAEEGTSYRADAHRSIELENAIMDRLGYGVQDGQIVHADAHQFADNLTQRATGLIRPAEAEEMLRMAIPVRQIAPWTEYYDLDFVGDQGKAAFIQSNQTPEQIPLVGYNVARTKGRAHWAAVRTYTSWMDTIYSQSPGALDDAAEQARIARRALERLLEGALANGVSGLDFVGLPQLAIPRIRSDVDFSSATLGAKATEMIRLLQRAATAANYTGVRPSVGLSDPRLLQLLRSSNNLDAGGSESGPNPIMAGINGEGVRSLMDAPTLPASSRGAGYSQSLLWAPGVDGALQQVVGLAPSPVSTAAKHGTETIWAMKTGGLECGRADSALVLDIQVA